MPASHSSPLWRIPSPQNGGAGGRLVTIGASATAVSGNGAGDSTIGVGTGLGVGTGVGAGAGAAGVTGAGVGSGAALRGAGVTGTVVWYVCVIPEYAGIVVCVVRVGIGCGDPVRRPPPPDVVEPPELPPVVRQLFGNGDAVGY